MDSPLANREWIARLKAELFFAFTNKLAKDQALNTKGF
jgi:hypothetical protein